MGWDRMGRDGMEWDRIGQSEMVQDRAEWAGQ